MTTTRIFKKLATIQVARLIMVTGRIAYARKRASKKAQWPALRWQLAKP